MKVVFIEDVPNVGKAGELKEVPDGYGRNFLIPKKLATPATTDAIKNIEAQIKKRAIIEAKTEEELVELAAQLEGKEVNIEARIGEQDRLYGSITASDIAEKLKSSSGLNVDKRKIELDEPIRQVGSHEVILRLGKEITAKITVTVTGKPED